MRTMYDSVTASDIPLDAQMVAGYVDGNYVWTDADWGRFPNAVKVRIVAFAGTNDGHVLDIETGNATPVEGPGWVRMRRAAGVDPSVYCNQSTWPSVAKAFADQGVPEPHYWIAAWNGDPTVYPGMVAHQYANPDLNGGAHYDLSAVLDFWPGVDGGGGGGGNPVREVVPAQPIPVVVFDTPANDRSFLDYNSVAYVAGQVAGIGAVGTWSRAKLVTDPARGGVKWLLHWDGSAWAVWADAATSGGQPLGTATNPDEWVGVQPPPAPPPTPTPTPPPTLDGVRAAWSGLQKLLNQDVPAAAAALDKAIADLISDF